jgi:hypothetical protein
MEESGKAFMALPLLFLSSDKIAENFDMDVFGFSLL